MKKAINDDITIECTDDQWYEVTSEYSKYTDTKGTITLNTDEIDAIYAYIHAQEETND